MLTALLLTTLTAEPGDGPNPERGFYVARYPHEARLDREDLDRLRGEGISVISYRVLLAPYRGLSQPIPSDFLKSIEADFATALDAGVKLMPLFYYAGDPEQPDAPLPTVLKHIRQLRPILRKNSDLIATMEMGLIGAWGEEHTSANRLTEPAPYRRILDAVLDALPRDRTVLIRYAPNKMRYFGVKPLTEDRAWNGSAASRIGHRNLFFTGDAWNGHTYWWDWDSKAWPPPSSVLEAEKDWLSQECLYVPNMFEADTGQREDRDGDGAFDGDSYRGENAVADARRLRMSLGMREYNRGIINRWRKDRVGDLSAFDTLARDLGYRFQIVGSPLPETVRPGQRLSLRIVLRNDGFAPPINPRPVEIGFPSDAGRIDWQSIRSEVRSWRPGREITLRANVRVPRRASGTVELWLRLPDASARLRDRAEYAIRLDGAEFVRPLRANKIGSARVVP